MKTFVGVTFFCSGVLVAFLLVYQHRSERGLEGAAPVDTPQAARRITSGGGDGASVANAEKRVSSRSDTANGSEPSKRQVTSPQIDTDIFVPATGPDALRSESSVDANVVPVLDGMELDGTAKMLHKVLEQERKDYSWADRMEADVYDYFASNTQKLGKHFGVPNVVCRQTLCEIQVIGYGQASKQTWEVATSDMHSQPWAKDMVEMELRSNPIGPDSTGFLLILKKGDTESSTPPPGFKAKMSRDCHSASGADSTGPLCHP